MIQPVSTFNIQMVMHHLLVHHHYIVKRVIVRGIIALILILRRKKKSDNNTMVGRQDLDSRGVIPAMLKTKDNRHEISGAIV